MIDLRPIQLSGKEQHGNSDDDTNESTHDELRDRSLISHFDDLPLRFRQLAKVAL
jgi:hypothetical protein